MKTLVNSLNCRQAAWALALCALLISAFALRAEETVNYTLETVWEKQEYPPIIVTAAKFHPSGEFIYCAIGNEIRKMDAKTGEYVSIFDKKGIPSEANIYKMEMSKDGKFLATTSLSSELFVWDVTEEKFIKEVKVANQTERQSIYAVDFKEQSNIVVFALDSTIDYPNITEKTTVVVYDWQLEKEVFRFDCPGSISELKASPDGKFIATGASWCDVPVKKWHDQLTLWSGADGKHVKTLEDYPTINTWNGYNRLSISSDNKYLGIIEADCLPPVIYDLNTFKLIYHPNVTYGYSLGFIPMSDIIATGLFKDDKPILELYDLKLQQSLIKESYYSSILESAVLPGNKVLLYNFSPDRTNVFALKKTIGTVEPVKETIPVKILVQKNKLFLKIDADISNEITVSIFNLIGKQIYKEKYIRDNQNNIAIDIELKSGIYLCKIIADGKEYTQKIEVAR